MCTQSRRRNGQATGWRLLWASRPAAGMLSSESRRLSSWPRRKRWESVVLIPGMIPLPFLPVVDGVLLPEHPLTAVAHGEADGIDLMIGTNRDELTLFGLGNPALMAMDEDGVTRWVANAVPDMSAEEVIDAYRSARAAARGTGRSQCHLGRLRDGHRVSLAQPPARRHAWGPWLARLRLPVRLGVAGLRRDPGSCHALELPFVFGAVHLPVVQVFSGGGPAVETLSAQMQRAWLAFAADGRSQPRRHRQLAAPGTRSTGPP